MNVNTNLMTEDVIQTKVRIKIKVDDDCKNPRKHHECEKIYISNPWRSNCEHGKYSESIMSALVVCVIKLQGPQNLFQKTFFHKNCSNKNCWTKNMLPVKLIFYSPFY